MKGIIILGLRYILEQWLHIHLTHIFKKKEDILKEFERIDFLKIYFDQLQKIYITVLKWQMMK